MLLCEPINGAIRYEAYNMDFNDNYEFYQDPTGKWHVIVIDPLNQTLQGARISDFPTLTITNKARPQKVRLYARSDYSDEATDFFEFNLQNYIPPKPKENKKFPWWGILLIILGVLGLGAGGYFLFIFLKKRKQRESDMISLQHAEQAGASSM